MLLRKHVSFDDGAIRVFRLFPLLNKQHNHAEVGIVESIVNNSGTQISDLKMNADYGYLVNLIKSNFIPVVLVVCTPEAEAICKKNNQTIIQLLWTYCFNFTTEQVRGTYWTIVTNTHISMTLYMLFSCVRADLLKCEL